MARSLKRVTIVKNREESVLVKRTYRVCVRAVAGVVLVLAALVIVAAIRLSAGPVDLDFLKPQITRLIDVPGNEIRPEFDRLAFEWTGISEPMKLVFHGLRFANGQNQIIASAPDAALTFEPRSVFQGVFLPTTIVVERPVIEADIARDGGVFKRIFTSDSGGAQGEAVSILIDQLLAEPNYKSLMGQLDSVKVAQAKVTLRDLRSGLVWTAPAANAELRRDAAGVSIKANARFIGHGDPVDTSLSGVYTRDRSRISVEAGIDGFKPWVFADLSPDLVLLRGVDVKLSGRMQIEATGQGEIRTVGVDITGGAGNVTLPGILQAAHEVRGLTARFSVDTTQHTANIDKVEMDFGAARILVTGSGTRTSDSRTFAGRAEIRQIPIDKLGDYWPLEFATGGREWAMTNLSKGALDVAAEFALSSPVDDISAMKVDRLVGLLDYGGMTVRYMPHMPELQDVSGKARYENGTLRFDVERGSAVGLKVTDGTIELAALDSAPPQTATLRLPITGSAQDVIRFLARPKLGLSKDVLYDHRRLGGEAAIDLSLSFPLINALAVSDIDIKADATLTSFSLKDVLGELDLTDATARLKYGDSEFNVAGQGKLDGNAIELTWREMFAAKAPFRRRYDVKGTVNAGIVAKAGFPSVDAFMSGPIGTTLSYQVATNNTSEVVGRFDLKGAKVFVEPLSLTKEAGADGLANLTLKLAPGGKLTAAEFEGRGAGLQAKGQARFGPDNVLQQVTMQQAKLGRSDLSFDWKRVPGGVEVALKGQSLELARVQEALRARNEIAKREPKGPAADARASTKMTIQIQDVILKHGSLGYLNGRFEMMGDRVTFADLGLGGGKGSTFRVTPGQSGRTLFLYVADFGQLLSQAGWMDGLVNGYLHIEGKFNDLWADPPLDGTLKMGPYRLQKVTPRAEIGTLNAAIDGLNSAGNALQQFDSLSANVSKAADRIQIRNGRTSGQSIGLTTQGTVDIGNDTAQLYGVIVPAFALNNLLSNVPLLGPLLTGGKDGGLFAISYRLHGRFDDLKSDVNMMSAVTPGALREIFNTPPTDTSQAPPPR
ncbi:DUF3971 domain-containing protein [Reyranella sp.]|uniref:YhdP family protein n=1 Tax=Reyranella sp. TaxID=1929291 RepID=UPI0025DA5EE4|nr:DUF3971 domain-containing protein [Reyranella sp.]